MTPALPTRAHLDALREAEDLVALRAAEKADAEARCRDARKAFVDAQKAAREALLVILGKGTPPLPFGEEEPKIAGDPSGWKDLICSPGEIKLGAIEGFPAEVADFYDGWNLVGFSALVDKELTDHPGSSREAAVYATFRKRAGVTAPLARAATDALMAHLEGRPAPVPSTEAADWRCLGLDRLDLVPKLESRLIKAGVKSLGQLADRLDAGDMLGLDLADHRDVDAALAKVRGDDEAEVPVPAKTAKKRRKAAAV